MYFYIMHGRQAKKEMPVHAGNARYYCIVWDDQR
jgi:hypothetical protein